MKRGPRTKKLVTVLNASSEAPVRVSFAGGALEFKRRFGKWSRRVEVHTVNLSDIYDRCTGQLVLPLPTDQVPH